MLSLSEPLNRAVLAARDVAQSVTALHAATDDLEARWPAETMTALADAGLMGLAAITPRWTRPRSAP